MPQKAMGLVEQKAVQARLEKMLSRKHKVDKLVGHVKLREMADKCFDACDFDSSGKISPPEAYAGVLLLYTKINDMAPCKQPPPTKNEVLALIDAMDTNRDHVLDRAEFTEFV